MSEMFEDFVMQAVRSELDRAMHLHGDFKSAKEGIACIREEYLELELAVFWPSKDYDWPKVIEEAKHLAAMATKMMQYALIQRLQERTQEAITGFCPIDRDTDECLQFCNINPQFCDRKRNQSA